MRIEYMVFVFNCHQSCKAFIKTLCIQKNEDKKTRSLPIVTMSTANDNECDLSQVVLQVKRDSEDQGLTKPHKQPSRILHFSDGDLVEYSDDEIDSPPTSSAQKALVDPKTLGWLSWTWYQTSWVSTKMLEGCDCVGEALADFLGITSPKYHFEIEEYKRQQLAEAEEKLRTDQETRGWIEANANSLIMEEVHVRE